MLEYGYQKANLAVSIVFAVLSTLAVVARLGARRRGKAVLRADDYIICVVLVLCLGLCIMFAWGAVNGGVGVPITQLPPNTVTSFLKIVFAQELISTPAVGLVKVSVLLFYKRVFTTAKFHFAANVLIALCIGWTISITIALLVRFVPVDLEWQVAPYRDNYSTLNFADLMIAMGATDIALDLSTLCLPMPMISRLNMPLQKKILIGGIFALGSFCVVASIVRLVYIVEFLNVYGTKQPFTGYQSGIAIWSNIEPCASVICACLPTLGPLFRGQTLESFVNGLRSYNLSRSWIFRSRSRSRGYGKDISLESPGLSESSSRRRLGEQNGQGFAGVESLGLVDVHGIRADETDGIMVKREYGVEATPV